MEEFILQRGTMIRFLIWPTLFGFIGVFIDSISNDHSGSLLNHVGILFGISFGLLFAYLMQMRRVSGQSVSRKLILRRWSFAIIGGLLVSFCWVSILPEGENPWLAGSFGIYLGFVGGGVIALAMERLIKKA